MVYPSVGLLTSTSTAGIRFTVTDTWQASTRATITQIPDRTMHFDSLIACRTSFWSPMGSQRAHHDAIVHLGDSGRPPGHSFGFIALDPGTHLSLEYDLSAARLDGDLICIHVGTAPEGLLDFLLDVGGFDARLDFDVVDNALYTLYGARCSFGGLPLI